MTNFLIVPSQESNSRAGLENQKKPIDLSKESSEFWVKASFKITYILLLTTGTITLIESLRAEKPIIRHIFNLETCISLVAGYFYSLFVSQIDENQKENKPLDWANITKMRYIDWSITTPFMLLVLCAFLANESKKEVTLRIVGTIFALNYIMLGFGYLGEVGKIDRILACVGGFIPFIALYYIIYKNFITSGEKLKKYFLFFLYLFFWTGYGLVFLLEESYKNIAMNILDCISKCFIGIVLWVYYTNIVTKL
jgi:bacteriorhodopsin